MDFEKKNTTKFLFFLNGLLALTLLFKIFNDPVFFLAHTLYYLVVVLEIAVGTYFFYYKWALFLLKKFIGCEQFFLIVKLYTHFVEKIYKKYIITTEKIKIKML